MKKRTNIRKMVLCAIFASLAFVLNTFVYFPAMAPFQHFVNVMAPVTAWMVLPDIMRITPQRNALTQPHQGPRKTAAITFTKCWKGAMTGKYTKVLRTNARLAKMAQSTIFRMFVLFFIKSS